MIVIYYNIIIVIIYNIFKGESIVNFNEVLRQLRKGTIYTQEELANKLGLLRSTYAKYETGENEPDYKTLVKIANYYGVSTDVLLGRNVKENNNMYNSCEEIKQCFLTIGLLAVKLRSHALQKKRCFFKRRYVGFTPVIGSVIREVCVPFLYTR